MATGDQADMVARLKSVLPTGWFPATSPGAATSATPILDGLLNGPAWALAWAYSLLTWVYSQMRLPAMAGAVLDLFALDYFGSRIYRFSAEGDTAFRNRISAELLRPKATRAGLVEALTDLTGRAPMVFEPRNPSDCGGYTLGGVGYGVAGGYGNLQLPFQCFVTAYRPTGGGIAYVSGYGDGAGGYGVGAIEYGDLDMVESAITDADIQATITDVIPVAVIPWLRITN